MQIAEHILANTTSNNTGSHLFAFNTTISSGFIIGGIVTYCNTCNPAPKTLGNFQIISFTRTQSALAGAVVGAGVGCLLGAAVKGLTHKVFKIHGKKENLFEMKDKMIGELYGLNN